MFDKIETLGCKKILASSVSAILAGAFSAPLQVVAAEGSMLLEEVVITAQKREQNLQDVGISVTAFTGDQLNELGFTNAIDVVAQTPGVSVSGAGGGTVATFSIRGVTQNDFSPAQESPVAVYIDEIYISQNSITNFSLFDLQRVEVLRGPHGTLFGRNATGGLLNYVTARPTQEVEGFVDLQVGEEGRKRIEGAVSGGLTDTISGRLAGVYNESDGLIDNRIGDDLMALDDYTLRGQLLFEPSEVLDVLLKAQYGDEDSQRGGYAHKVGFDGVFSKDPNATDFFGYRGKNDDPWKGEMDFDGYREVQVSDYGLFVNWDIGDYTLTSISNYQDVDHKYGEDSDVSPNSVYNYEQKDDVQQYSQELRLSWDGDNYQAVVGLFYLEIDADYKTTQTGDVFFTPGFDYILTTAQNTKTYALFGQIEYDLTNTLSLVTGIRFNRDEKDYSFDELGVRLYSDDLSDDDVAGKIQLDYRPNDDWLWYVSANRGIKSGGFNMPLEPPPNFSNFPYDSEVLWAYEAGFKTSLTDRTRLNTSIYYYDYDDYQAYTFDGFVPLLFNASAEMYGAEIELVTSPIDGLDIMIGGSWLDASVDDLPSSLSPSGSEDPVLAPEFTLNGLVRYSWSALGGSIAVQADGNWQDDRNFNLSVTPVIEEGSTGILNARVTYTTDSDAWQASVFVKNLTDEDYRAYAFDTTSFFGAVENVPGPERWYGANLRYRF